MNDAPARLADQVLDLREDVECAPEQRANAARDDLHHSRSHYRPEGGPLPMMMHQPPRENPQPVDGTPPDAATLARLQRLLAEALHTRETALAEIVRLRDELKTAGKHWYVDGGNGYCAACALPRANGRHAPRVAVA